MRRDGEGDLARKYIRAARQRFAAVQFLFDAGLYFEAVYLAGYVIECSLKAIILSRVLPKSREHYASMHFRGRSGHNFEFLRIRLAELGSETPGQLLRDFRGLKWSTELRYQVGAFDRIDAMDFIAASRRVLEWAQRNM